MTPLDRIDHQILAALSADARLSMTALGAQVHLSRTAVLARVQRLEAAGVIQGYHARLQWPEAVPGVSALLLLQFDTRPCAPVLDHLRGLPEVRRVWSLSGPHDAVAEVQARDLPALYALGDRLASGPYRMHVDTRLVLGGAG